MFYLLICVSGLGSVTHGYHGYHYPTPPTPFHMAAAPSFGHYGPGSQPGFQHSPLQTQWQYEWDKPSGNAYGSSKMGHNHANEMSPSSELTSIPSDNYEAVSDRERSKPTLESENDLMDLIKINDTKTTPSPPKSTTTNAPFGPQPGTMSKPVPKLGELFAPSLQWHVGIYSKRFTPYMQECGGSLVRPDVVLSAAHCFWNDEIGKLREGLFGVAAGKLLRPWETEGEIFTQHSEIKEIKIPPRFQGAKSSFQDDIAIVLLSSPLEYAPGVKPICLSFDQETERRLLKSGNLGTIAGWGLTMPNGPPSQRLNYLELPYVDIQDCIRNAEPSFLKYITSDKICAGDKKTGRALCKGDSGGGLTYYADKVPYLVGIASVALRDKHECNAYAVGTFTYARAHSAFLQEHVPMIGEGCEGLYSNATAVQNETIAGVTQSPTIEEVKVQIPQLGEASPNVTTDDKTSNIVTDNGGIMEPVTTDQKKVQRPQLGVALPNVTDDQMSSIVTGNGGKREPVTDPKTNETTGVTQGEQILLEQLEVSLPDAADRTFNIFVKEPVTDQKMVMMSVESGERSVVRVPVEGASMLVCNCYCKN